MKQASLLVVGALLALVGCRGERTVGPRTPQGATPQPAATAAPTKTFLSVSPTSLTFSGAGANQQSLTASTAVRTLLHAFTSNQEVATVNPPAATTSKDMGGYSAPFAVTPVGVGRATVTVTDRKGHQAAVAVTVLGKLFYVANAGADNIEVFAAGENGDAAPMHIIGGSSTQLGSPTGVALNAASELYATNYQTNSITIYASGADGNVAPQAIINMALNGPAGVAFDASGNLYVANSGNSSITVYAAPASGDAMPVATIGGNSTGLSSPYGLTYASGRLYVTNYGNNTITVYDAGGNGDVMPAFTIRVGLSSPSGLTFDASGELYVANAGADNITVYAAGAGDNAMPVATIGGSNTQLNRPTGVVFDESGNLFVTNQGANSITVYAAGASGNATPVATIVGSSTGLNGPRLLRFSP